LKRLQSEFERQICVIGFAREKSITPILEMLPKQAYYIFTQASSPRALAAESLAQQGAEQGLQGEVQPTVAKAIARARELATERDMIFIGGSNFVVAEI
jgi:dihydrofolate synthase/folylpolyglutamate synthase